MKRLQLDLDPILMIGAPQQSIVPEIKRQAKKQGFEIKGETPKEVAIFIRDDLNLKHCTRLKGICNVLIFTEI